MVAGTASYETRTYPAGSLVFREGQGGREAYLLKRGRVTLSRTLEGTEAVLASLGAGEVFGEMAIIGEAPRSATATAAEEAELVVIDRALLKRALAQSPPLVRELMARFQERLLATTERLEPRSEAEAVRRTAEALALLADADPAAGDGGEGVAVRLRQLLTRGRRLTGLAEEELRAALRHLEAAGEVVCGPRGGGDNRYEQLVGIPNPERLGSRTASRCAAWPEAASAPEPAYLDLAGAAETLRMDPAEVLRGLLEGTLPTAALRFRAGVLDAGRPPET